MSSKRQFKPTPRDSALLKFLHLTPCTAEQLLKLSATTDNATPFTSADYLRKRMGKLAGESYVNGFYYQSDRLGAQKYYKLTLQGYRHVVGQHAKIPHRSYFKPVSPALQNHTKCVAKFTVKTLVSAHRHRIKVPECYGDKRFELRLDAPEERPDSTTKKCRRQHPDFTAQFKIKKYRPYNCFFEVDCGTESGFCKEQYDGLEQKVRFVLEYADRCPSPFRHYFLFETSRVRMSNYLQMVQEIVGNSQRTLFFAGLLSDYLACEDPLRMPIFYNRHRQPTSILPSPQTSFLPPQPLSPTLREQLVAA